MTASAASGATGLVPVAPGTIAPQAPQAWSPVRDDVAAPDYGYVERLVRERERLFATRGWTVNLQGQERFDRTQGIGLDTIIREIRLRRELRLDPRVPRNYKKTTQVVRAGQSLLADLAIRLPAILTAKPMQVRFQPLDDSDEARSVATLKQDWTHALLFGVEGRRGLLDVGKTSVWRDWYDNLLNAGRGAFHLICRPDRWSAAQADFPNPDDFEDDPADPTSSVDRLTRDDKYKQAVDAYKRQNLPFVLENLDPLMVHIKQDEDGIEDEAIIVQFRPYRETLVRYGLVPTSPSAEGANVMAGKFGKYVVGPAGLSEPYPVHQFPTVGFLPDGVETVTYYCSARRAAYLGLNSNNPEAGCWAQYVDGVLVDWGGLLGPPDHPLPVFRAFGLSTAIPDPTYTGIPMPFHILELCDVLDQVFTLRLHLATWTAWAPLIEEDKTVGGIGATGMPGDVLADPESLQRPSPGGGKEKRTIEPATYIRMKPGRTLRYLTYPPEATANLDKLEQEARALIDLLGLPSVFRGEGGVSQSGYAANLMQIAARTMYDPVTENGTAVASQAVKYLHWQVWRRFPDGVPVFYSGDPRRDRKGGWISLGPKDIAPGSRGMGKGTPFTICTVKADPLMPQDEAQKEQRGQNALAAGILDMDRVREDFYGDAAPEKTSARVLADKVVNHPWVQQSLIVRGMVRQQLLKPELAPLLLSQSLGIPVNLAMEQLQQIGALEPEDLQRLQALQLQQQLIQQQQMIQAQMSVAPQLPQMPGMGPGPGMTRPAPAIPGLPYGAAQPAGPAGPGGPPGGGQPPGAGYPGGPAPMGAGTPAGPAPPPGVQGIAARPGGIPGVQPVPGVAPAAGPGLTPPGPTRQNLPPPPPPPSIRPGRRPPIKGRKPVRGVPTGTGQPQQQPAPTARNARGMQI